MGGLNPFKKPKVPAPPPLPPPPTEASVADDPALTEERLRRQRAAGRQGNIKSNLRGSVQDENVGTRKSVLLG